MNKIRPILTSRCILVLGLFLIICAAMNAEVLTLYTGFTSIQTRYLGATLGGEVFPYLHFQLDVFKFTKKLETLSSAMPEQDRSDFLSASLDFALKLPIYLIPHLDRLSFLEPYILVGYGAGLENLKGVYFDVPNADGKTGFFTKLRPCHSYGAGLVVMLTPGFGVKFDYRSINMPGLEKMGYPSRKFNRFSFGVCLGASDSKK